VGLFALFTPIAVPAFAGAGIAILVASGACYFVTLALFGRLPRWAGGVAICAYGTFLYRGLL